MTIEFSAANSTGLRSEGLFDALEGAGGVVDDELGMEKREDVSQGSWESGWTVG
jgi:hypothetical protein